jgi:hypothetical protein
MSLRKPLSSFSLVVIAGLGLSSVGCQRPVLQGTDLAPLTQDEPLVIRILAKNRLQVGERTFAGYSDANFDAYLKLQHDRYRAFYDSTGTPLRSVSVPGPNGRECKETLPTQVILLVDPEASMGTVNAVERKLREHAFGMPPERALAQDAPDGTPVLAPFMPRGARQPYALPQPPAPGYDPRVGP